jgi:hypothetical protein
MWFFGQTDSLYDYNYDYTVTTTDAGLFGVGLGMLLLFSLAFWVVSVIALWKVFEKAGEKGWKALIPIYNFWVLCEIAGRPGWWSLSILLAWIPFVGWIVPFVVWIIVALDLGKAFGQTTLFSVLALIIFSFIGLLILGFGDAKYHKPGSHKTSTPAPAA